MILFLHEKGYNHFNIPNLLYSEIGSLVDSQNRKMKKEEKEYKKAEQKAKRARR